MKLVQLIIVTIINMKRLKIISILKCFDCEIFVQDANGAGY